MAVARAGGWEAARDLVDEEFVGWEVDFLGHAIVDLEAFEQSREAERLRGRHA